jgi:hypothetical protein
MKIATLSHKDVAGWYAATLMERGYEIIISGGGAIHAPGLKPYLECDSCLLLGNESDLLEIADYMEASGKKVWRKLSDVPVAQPRNSKREEDIGEPKRVECVATSPAPAGRWWIVLEYDNRSAAVAGATYVGSIMAQKILTATMAAATDPALRLRSAQVSIAGRSCQQIPNILKAIPDVACLYGQPPR